jgi:hypothetical protein
MHQEPVPQQPGRDENPSGVPARPGDHPWLGSPHWRLMPQSPDWDEAYLAARADDEYPGDLEEYEDPDGGTSPSRLGTLSDRGNPGRLRRGVGPGEA